MTGRNRRRGAPSEPEAWLIPSGTHRVGGGVDPSSPTPDRRALLGAGGSAALRCLLPALLAGRSPAHGSGVSKLGQLVNGTGYGPLAPRHDETTGLPLLRLPAKFRYLSFGWRGDPLAGGGVTPDAHDGMGVVARSPEGILTIVRNHERRSSGTPFGPSTSRYDARGRGGTTTLRFDSRNGRWLDAFASLGGTSANCAGGPAPWGSWLTCEETLDGRVQGFGQNHGWVFEVPANAPASAVPLTALERFAHEALAVDPRTGFIYLTEDARYASGLYRFRPSARLATYALEAGGALEMLRVHGQSNADLELVLAGQTFEVSWVPVADPALGPQGSVGPFGSFDGQTRACSGPFLQGFQGGGARFRRLEGAWHDPLTGRLYFVDTEGGLPAPDTGIPEGALWCYEPRSELLRCIYTSPAQSVLDSPDNVTVGPGGGLLVCEDGDLLGTRLSGLGKNGELFVFAQNDVVLAGQVNGFRGDFRGSEWAGASFDPSGRWLFVNLQDPGITFAITGPWELGPL
jgi:secreted PhoX family phosphatase